ncbi:MAG: autotransporter domain-containing protein, partial [Pontiellaceae bacterium]|nr:autotransporter domain-containing protein [Pontiellaceae bacterium]MBN2784268.1 autotransporter domain-containing protein [Pontiellaceae bacterium]
YDSSNNWVNGGTGNSLTVEAGGLVLVGDVDTNNLPGIAGIVVGDAFSNNVEMVAASGSIVNCDAVYMGLGNGEHGRIRIEGSNTVWNTAGDFYVGHAGSNNVLTVSGSSALNAGGDFYNRYSGSIYMEPTATVSVSGDYVQDASSLLRFGVETNASGAPLTALISVGGTAEFEAGAQIVYGSNVGELTFDTVYTNKLIAAETLIVAGVTNANSKDLEQLDASGSLVDVMFWESEQAIYALAGRVALSESAGFTNNAMMGSVAAKIDELSLSGSAGAVDMINLLNTLTGAEQSEQLEQQYASGAPTYLHARGLAEGMQEIVRQTSHNPAQTPSGASGPEFVEQGMRGWIKTYGSWGERSATAGSVGYDQNLYGTVVGVDWTQDDLLFGVAGGFVRSVVKQDNDDRSVAKTGYGAGYVSYSSGAWFADAQLALGVSSVEDQSGSVFGNTAEYDAVNAALYLGGGRELCSSCGHWILTPEASLLLSEYMQEEYTERGMVPRIVDDYERFSIRSGLGATLAFLQNVDCILLKPSVHTRWIHEFNADSDTIDYSLAAGSDVYQFEVAATEEDLLETGAGVSCTFNAGLTIGVYVDWLFGEDYDAYKASGRLMYEF